MNTLAIVVNYNDVENLLKTVASLVSQADVVVWDNGSVDSSKYATSRAFTQVEFHSHPENILWTPALNAATDLYWDGQQNLLYSNNDIVYEPNAVKQMEEALTDQVGLVGPSGSGLGSAQDFAIWYGAKAPGWGQGMNSRLRGYIATLPTVRTPHVVGAAMMVAPQLRHDIGAFDNDMPLGADDHDYCIRAREAGYSIWVVHSSHVSHRSHASFRHTRRIWEKHSSASWDVFNQKWAGYFLNKEEAVKVQWGDTYHPGWDVGTGWLELAEREKIWEVRKKLAVV